VADPIRAVELNEHGGMFMTTRWSLVISGGSPERDERKAREALADLCRAYWRPVFSFISRRGYSREDAQDLTQDFFLMVVEQNWLRHADVNRGRFRSFLLKSVQNFLSHDADRQRTQKRGGDVLFISWDDPDANAPWRFSQEALEKVAPEQVFDFSWAATVVEQAMRRLKQECEMNGRGRLFEVLSAHLVAERADVSYAELARDLSVAETAIKKQLHLLRQRYRSLLREEVAETVANPADVDEEIRYLCATLGASAT